MGGNDSLHIMRQHPELPIKLRTVQILSSFDLRTCRTINAANQRMGYILCATAYMHQLDLILRIYEMYPSLL